MKEPIFARQLSDEERKTLKAGLRSPDAFVLRRCQLLLTSATTTNKSAYQIARDLGCNSQTVRNVIHKFNEEGLEATLKKGSRRPHTTAHKAFDDRECERLRELLHQSPRNFGKDTSLWTLELAAKLSFEEGLTERRVSGETIRATLSRMGVNWRRAKRWITSPDPEYARKKACATG
jgi:transposase